MIDKCQRARACLTAFLDDECPPGEVSFLENHLAACPACRAEYEMALAIREEISDTSRLSTADDRRRIVEIAAPLLRRPRPTLRAARAVRTLAVAALVLFAIWLAVDGGFGPADRRGPVMQTVLKL